MRLVESLDGVCDRILQYNIHKERTDSTRFAKGMSQTFQALHGLVDKGVKVELGIPYELWDRPSAEITNMKTQVSLNLPPKFECYCVIQSQSAIVYRVLVIGCCIDMKLLRLK